MSRWGRLPCAALLLAGACINGNEVGVLQSDGGLGPRETLQLQVQGRWCGTASLLFEQQEVVLDIGPESYTVRCDCEEPFPGESALDGSSGRYAITDYALNGEGWGRAQHDLPQGGVYLIRLEHIVASGDSLRFERVAWFGPNQRVVVDLSRCEG